MKNRFLALALLPNIAFATTRIQMEVKNIDNILIAAPSILIEEGNTGTVTIANDTGNSAQFDFTIIQENENSVVIHARLVLSTITIEKEDDTEVETETEVEIEAEFEAEWGETLTADNLSIPITVSFAAFKEDDATTEPTEATEASEITEPTTESIKSTETTAPATQVTAN